jgi:hypothetical protein
MPPTRVVLRSVARSGMALALLLPVAAVADTPPPSRNPITEGYRYTPAPASAAAPPAEDDRPAAATNPGQQPRKRLLNPTLRLPAVPIDATVPAALPPPTSESTAPATAPGILIFPKITVNGEKEKARTLPRLHVDAPVKDLPAPFWENPAGRRTRLVQKHFTALEQKLDSQKSLEARATRKEAIESAARELNRIAAAVELSALLGQEDAEAQEKLRAEFLRAFYSRPR